MARAIVIRLIVSVVIALIASLGISELTYRMVEGTTAQPQEYELIIPVGTSERLAKGEQVVGLPKQLTFVEGDVIVVINQDTVSHQLGPIWVPAGATGKLALERPVNYSMECSFLPEEQMGLAVEPRVNSGDRMRAMLSMGLPTAVILWLFWLVAMPPKSKEQPA
jgi:hypothetical protein